MASSTDWQEPALACRAARRLSLAGRARLDLLEEVVALVVHEDEGGEVGHFNLPHGFHAEFGIFHALDALDVLLREDGCGTADGAEVETAVLLARIGHHLRAVALGDHHERAAVFLEEVHVGVHASGRRRAHGAAGHAGGRLGGSGVEHGMVLDVFGQAFAAVEAFLQLGVCDVAGASSHITRR